MHSSRMRTVRCNGRLELGVGVCLGVSVLGGVCLGGVSAWGVSVQGGDLPKRVKGVHLPSL